MTSSLVTPVAVLILGWLLASGIGSWAYFAGKSDFDDSFPLPRFMTKR
ncbi:MAG TPA: hypothetical protein V6D09_08250 [Leptolyngbyaceae cyanobacterium]